MSSFLIIMEDGNIVSTPVLDEGTINACDDGYVNIVDISTPDDPKTYIEGGWEPIEPA